MGSFKYSFLIFQVLENVNIGYVVGSVATMESSIQENILYGTNVAHITYTLISLMPDRIKNAFEIDHNTGSLVVSHELDRETQEEYRLEVRALDTTAMNNPQSSAVIVQINIADVNDNSPQWSQDPIILQIAEDLEVGSLIYNFTATDADYGNNGDLRYTLIKQIPINSPFMIDALSGILILTAPLDYELLQEYTIVVKATDQSLNISHRLASTVTTHILVTDSNDNSPKFVIPSPPNIFITETVSVGSSLAHIVAADRDTGDNGRVTYVISGGNDKGEFALEYETGYLTLMKPLQTLDHSKSYTLNITASDHGNPVKYSIMELRLSLLGMVDNPPMFLNTPYQAFIAEDAPVGSFVIKISAKSGHIKQGKSYLRFYRV